MKRALGLIVGAACWILVGCASQPERSAEGTTAAVAPAKPKRSQVCREEAPAGSIIKKTRCVSQEQFEEERAAAERSIKSNSDRSNSGRPGPN